MPSVWERNAFRRIATLIALVFYAIPPIPVSAQPSVPSKATPPSVPLHTMQPDYPVPYGVTNVENVTEVLNRIREYLEASTPARVIHRQTREEIKDFTTLSDDAVIERGSFDLISYEWGVAYSGMLLAGEATGDARFTDYTARRLRFIADLFPYCLTRIRANPEAPTPLRSVLTPRALDDAGSMCAAMTKALRAGIRADVRPMIDNYIGYIGRGQFRLPDGTLARNRPQSNTLWLDDLYMSVPALAQMGKLTGNRVYFDDAVKQVLQFSERMFNKEKNLFMHGWVADMKPHPEFFWARANGWAILTMVELLDVLPEDHPGRAAVLDLLRAHIRGLAARQSGKGLWHQLLDRNDSYLETSATAIFVHCMARAINRGWIDPVAHGPMALLGWNAITTKVNAEGQVEGVCVGTGMAFDPAFYYYRPTNVFAAHGYGPVLLAGAEIIRLLKAYSVEINDSSVQFYPKGAKP